jgi:chemotaxis methyl-accepting protein methylase
LLRLLVSAVVMFGLGFLLVPFYQQICEATGINNFRDYLALLENKDELEWEAFVNALTTNLTSFFREQHHFPLLAEHVLKQRHPIALWCWLPSP